MRLLLVGGGHSHQMLLENLPTSWLQEHEVTLISPYDSTLYSGMMPGYLAGLYSLNALKVPIKKYSENKGVQFVKGEIKNLQPTNNTAQLSTGEVFSYDVVSINIGSITRQENINISSDRTYPVKPIEPFSEALKHHMNATGKKRFAFIGGGAASLEVALGCYETFKRNQVELEIQIFEGSPKILSSHNEKVRNHFYQRLQNIGASLFENEKVLEINGDTVTTEKASHPKFDFIGLFTGAAAPKWLKTTGLPLEKGFIKVHPTLQSTAFENVFASGDVASVRGYDIPKAGVFAVKEGKLLAENILRFASGGKLKSYQPQSRFLSLLLNGHKTAVLSRGGLFLKGRYIWWLKNFIDQKYMRKFKDA